MREYTKYIGLDVHRDSVLQWASQKREDELPSCMTK